MPDRSDFRATDASSSKTIPLALSAKRALELRMKHLEILTNQLVTLLDKAVEPVSRSVNS